MIKRYFKWPNILIASIITVALIGLSGCSGKTEKSEVTNDTKTVVDKTSSSDKPITSDDTSVVKKTEIIHLTDQNFEEKISKGVVLVDFWATWCGPCRMMAPVLEKVNEEMAGKVTIAKLDIDKNRQTTDKYGILNIPALLMFKDGKMVNQFIGYTEKDILVKALKKELDS